MKTNLHRYKLGNLRITKQINKKEAAHFEMRQPLNY